MLVSYNNNGRRDYYEEYYKLVKAKLPDEVTNPWGGGVYFEDGKVILKLSNKYWKNYVCTYYSNRVELIPIGNKMFRKIKSEESFIERIRYK